MIPQSIRDQIRKEAEEKYSPRMDRYPWLRQAHIEAAEAMWIKCNAEAIPKSEVEKMLRAIDNMEQFTGAQFEMLSEYGFDISPKSNTQKQTEQ